MYASSRAICAGALERVVGRVRALAGVKVPVVAGAIVLPKPEILMC
jgi:hypothetical protein